MKNLGEACRRRETAPVDLGAEKLMAKNQVVPRRIARELSQCIQLHCRAVPLTSKTQ